MFSSGDSRKQYIVMQKSEKGGGGEATVDVQFTDLPNALIACRVPQDLFNEGQLKVRRRTQPSFSSFN